MAGVFAWCGVLCILRAVCHHDSVTCECVYIDCYTILANMCACDVCGVHTFVRASRDCRQFGPICYLVWRAVARTAGRSAVKQSRIYGHKHFNSLLYVRDLMFSLSAREQYMKCCGLCVMWNVLQSSYMTAATTTQFRLSITRVCVR